MKAVRVESNTELPNFSRLETVFIATKLFLIRCKLCLILYNIVFKGLNLTRILY